MGRRSIVRWLVAWMVLASCALANESDGTLVRALATAGTSRELWAALMDRKVTRVIVTSDIALRRDVWPGDDDRRRHAMVLRRDVILEGLPDAAGRLPVVDLDYMRFRVAPGQRRTLVVRRLAFSSAVKNSRDTELQLAVPFFTHRANATLVLDEVVSPVAVGLTAPLAALRFGLAGHLRPVGLEGRNVLSLVGDEQCRARWGAGCPDGGLVVEDYAGIVEVEDLDPLARVLKTYDGVLVIRGSLMVAVNVDNVEFNSTEDVSGRRTFVADNLFELFQAMMDPEVVTVHMFNDMVFDMSSWPNRHGHLIESCGLDRDVLITTHPTSHGKAKFDFNLAKNGISLSNNSTLTLKNVVLTRTSRNPNHTLTLPFFDVGEGSKLQLDGVVAHTPIRTTSRRYIKSFVDMLKQSHTAAPGHSVEYHKPSKCKNFTTRGDVPCDGGFLVTSVLPNVPMVDPDGEPRDLDGQPPGLVFVNNSFFSVLDLKKRRIKSEEEKLHRQQGIALVSTEGQLRHALQNNTVRTIWLRNNMNLTSRAWPGSRNSRMLVVDRDVTIASHPTTAMSLSIDLDYMIGRVAAGENHELFFHKLNFTRVSREGIHLHYVPFFCWQNNSTLSFLQVLSQMAVEPNSVSRLDKKYERDFTKIGGPEVHDVKVLGNNGCEEVAFLQCPDKALFITRGTQSIDVCSQSMVRDHRNGKQPCSTPESGIFRAEFMLILAHDVEKCPLFTREEEAAGLVCDLHRAVPGDITTTEETSDGPAFEQLGVNWTHLTYVLLGLFVVVVVLTVFIYYTTHSRKPPPSGQDAATVEEVATMKSTRDECVAQEHKQVAPELIDDMTLGPLMGVGSFARVYKAFWNGAPVAVKVILHQKGDVEARIEQEARLSTELRHPNIVQGYHFATRAVDVCLRESEVALGASMSSVLPQKGEESTSRSMTDMLESGSAQTSVITSSVLFSERDREPKGEEGDSYRETWLVQELCDKGTLMEGLAAGLFRRRRQASGTLILDYVIQTCQDIARGMKYLHDNNIVHGDLKSGNVLLQGSVMDPRGFVAKVADFGLSQQMVAKAHVTTSFYGTVTHMPPEVLMQGHLSLAADIYSFGMIMWEMMSGEAPFRNMLQMEVMRKVVLERQRPEFPSWTPEGYKALVDRCWCHDAGRRIGFQEIYDCLTGLLSSKPPEASLETWVTAQREQIETRSPMSPTSGRQRTGSLSGRRAVTSASSVNSRQGASGGQPGSWMSSSSFDDVASSMADFKDEWRR